MGRCQGRLPGIDRTSSLQNAEQGEGADTRGTWLGVEAQHDQIAKKCRGQKKSRVGHSRGG